MRFGYASVSTLEQSLDLQLDALNATGCDEIITDKVCGTVANLLGLNQLINYKLRFGDELIFYSRKKIGSVNYFV